MHMKQVVIPLLSGGAVYLAMAVRAADPPRANAPLVAHASEAAQRAAFPVAALTDPVAPVSAELAGTRLKPKYIQGADGSRVFVPDVFYDAELDVDCKFTMASDNKLRCLPEAPPFQANVIFLDDQCTQPVTEVFGPPAGCTAPPPKWILSFYNEGYCEVVTRARFYEFEGTLLSNVNVFRLHQGVCSGLGQTNVFTLKPEAPITTFVEGTPAVAP
jgi:hypothetical protein